MTQRETRKRAAKRATLELTRDDIGFSAAHFGILQGRSERLHGHNYRVSARVHGEVRPDGSVMDFALLKQTLRAACAELDERMLIPTAGRTLEVSENGPEVSVRHRSRRFVFPAGDVRLLPIENTTCECLAAYLLEAVRAGLGPGVSLEIRVEESPGQGATAAG